MMDESQLALSPEVLVKKIGDKANLLLLDLRCFMNYNQCHLESSINVCVPTALLKRKSFSVSNLESSIGCSESRDRFKNRQGSEVILYDSECDQEKKGAVLGSLLEKLKADCLVSSVKFLEGGFQNFFYKYPQLCSVKTPCPTALTIPSLSLLAAQPAGHQYDKEPVEIFDFLYVGSQEVSSTLSTLERYGITYILNAAKECTDHFATNPKFHYRRLDLLDCASQSIDLALFEEAFKFIDEARDRNQKVLVHCRAGQSRSATIVISYIIRTYRWTLHRAYRFVQEKRPSVSPNLGFIAQLVQFEQQVLGSTTQISKLLCPDSPLPPAPPLIFERSSGTSSFQNPVVTIDCK